MHKKYFKYKKGFEIKFDKKKVNWPVD